MYYLQTKHKKWIFSATIHLTRKRFIFPGRYLKADHFGKKLDMGGGPFKNAEVGGLKNYDQLKSPITWAIIGKFDNFGQI